MWEVNTVLWWLLQFCGGYYSFMGGYYSPMGGYYSPMGVYYSPMGGYYSSMGGYYSSMGGKYSSGYLWLVLHTVKLLVVQYACDTCVNNSIANC